MDKLITLIAILSPLFIGYFIRLPKAYLPLVDKGLSYLVYVILALIGVSLSQVNNLGEQLSQIVWASVLLFACTVGGNLLCLMWFDKKHPWQQTQAQQGTQARVSIRGSLEQLGCVALGFAWGRWASDIFLPPEELSTYALMLLILLVGIQLGGSSIRLHQVLINKRGVQTSLLMMASSLAGGIVFAFCFSEVSFTQGLAMASGFGWYSLSGIVMTEAYGAVWGSVALLNDLAREFFALMFIPALMRRYPSAAVGVGGATSLDFTLPIIQSSGGLAVVPLAISFGFIVNVVSPFLMVIFSSFA